MCVCVCGRLNGSMAKWVSLGEDAQSKKGLMCQDTLGCISALPCSCDTVCIPNLPRRAETVCAGEWVNVQVCHCTVSC